MRASDDWREAAPLSRAGLLDMLRTVIRHLDVAKARQEVDRFVRDKASLELWSREFFLEIVDRIEILDTRVDS